MTAPPSLCHCGPAGMFCVFDAVDGQVKGVFQENRFLTDVRTGAAGGVAIKYLAKPEHTKVGQLAGEGGAVTLDGRRRAPIGVLYRDVERGAVS